MSYSSYASSVSSKTNNVINSLDKIFAVNFSDAWAGKAHDNFIDKIDSISESSYVQINQSKKIANVLGYIDDYDQCIRDINSYKKLINSYDDSINWWNSEYKDYKNYCILLDSAIAKKSELYDTINNLLNSISVSYESKYKVMEFNNIINSENVFSDILSSNEKISDSLELDKIVTEKFINFDKNSVPNWDDLDAWFNLNPYVRGGNTGQCTWFAWGRFYEMYGYSGWSNGNGMDCARNLVSEHSDNFYLSSEPESGAVFSSRNGQYGHVGVVLDITDDMITYQDGNYNGHSDSFEDAQNDWGTHTITIDEFLSKYNYNVEFANPV